MGTRRAVVTAAAAAALVLLAVGASVWLYLRPRPARDCAIVNDMIKYSKSENERIRNLIPTGVDDPQTLMDAYQTRQTRLRQYADRIHDAGLREKADAVVNLDDKMLDAWRQTIPGQSPQSQRGSDGPDRSSAGQDFQRTYTDYAAQSQEAGQALQAACPP